MGPSGGGLRNAGLLWIQYFLYKELGLRRYPIIRIVVLNNLKHLPRLCEFEKLDEEDHVISVG